MKKRDDAQLLRLGDVLSSAHDFPWNYALYLPSGTNLTADISCLVLDPNIGVEGPDDVPAALQHNLRYSLDMQSVQGIIDNARTQLGKAQLDQLKSALDYYLKRDAFIDFSKP